MIENLDIQLKAAGAGWDDVVFRRTFVIDVDKFVQTLQDPKLPKFFNPDKPPPSTMIGVTRLSNPDFLIEIDLLAVTNE